MDESLIQVKNQIVRSRDNRLPLLRGLSLAERSAVFSELSPYVQQFLLTELRDGELVEMLDHMDPRQAEKIVARIGSDRRREKIIKRLKTEMRDKIEYFLRFHPKATTALIKFNYILLSSKTTIGEVAAAMDEHYDDTGKFPEVLVHENGQLIGEVSMATLVRERNTQSLKKFVTPVLRVGYMDEIAKIVEVLTSEQKKKVIVLDHDESVLGLIYADDAQALFNRLPVESLYDINGLDDGSKPFDLPINKFKARYRWLILNLATAFMAGSMIFIFKDTIDRLVIMAMYIPIVAGMGGNAAAQAFAVMLRGITLGTVLNFKTGIKAIKYEVIAGLYNGLIIGSIVAIISLLWNQSLMLGVVVGLSMIGVHVIAGLFGSMVPLLLKHFGKDPASTSTIFITTATDIFGLFFLLGLGTLLLI